MPGLPTAAVETADGHWAFASLTAPTGGALEVLSVTEGRMTPVRTVVLPGLSGAFGMALTHDGRLLVVAGHNETAVVSVAALETGKGAALVGTLVDNARASSRWRCRPTTITSS